MVGMTLAYGLIHATMESTKGDVWKELIKAKKPFLILFPYSYIEIIYSPGVRLFQVFQA